MYQLPLRRVCVLCFIILGKGRLIYNIELNPMPIADLLVSQYKWNPSEAKQFSDFLMPMLHYDPWRRATAQESLRHPWLRPQRPSPPLAEIPAFGTAATVLSPVEKSLAKGDEQFKTSLKENSAAKEPLLVGAM